MLMIASLKFLFGLSLSASIAYFISWLSITFLLVHMSEIFLLCAMNHGWYNLQVLDYAIFL